MNVYKNAPTMIGFPTKLSTEHVMLRMKNNVIDEAHSSLTDTGSVFRLDLVKTFDNVKRFTIIENINSGGTGRGCTITFTTF